MNVKVTISLLVVLLLCFISIWPAAAQGDCPAGAGTQVEYEVLQVQELAPGIPELYSANAQAVGAFYQNRINFTFESGQGLRVLLSSTANGTGCLRTDDWIEIRTSSGRVWSHDFRSPGRDTVLEITPVDITFLFEPGEQEVFIDLVDLMGPAFSSRPYYLIVVYDPTPPTSTPVPTHTPSPTPTYKPWPTPTATLIPTPTLAPPAAAVAPPIAPVPEPPASRPFLPLALAGLVGAAILAWWLFRSRPLLPPGQIDVYQRGRYLTTVFLKRLGKAVIKIGRAGDVAIGQGSEVIALIYARRIEGRKSQAMLGLVDPDQPEVVLESYPLSDGDVHLIGNDIKLVYHRYKVEKSFFEGEIANV